MILSGNVPKAQVIMYNFGSPRIFNWPLAQSVIDTIPIIFRVARFKDLFVHLPPCATNLFGKCVTGNNGPGTNAQTDNEFLALYDAADLIKSDDEENLKLNPIWHPWHISQNIFYTTEDNTQYTLCNGGEDPKCADKYSVLSCTIDDHLSYIGVKMGQCAIKNYLW